MQAENESRKSGSASNALLCRRDTNGDGDCHRCHMHNGCPFSVFTRCQIERATMSDEEAKEFRRHAEKFEYSEWMGTIKGYRNRDGRVLIEQYEPK